jgi:AraC-like DNA-binding protein
MTYARRMALALAPHYRPDRNSGPLARVADMAFALAPNDGHQTILFPSLCLYRFSSPTTFTKGATFGVTLGAVLQGEKRVIVDQRELVVDAANLLVITLEREFTVATTPLPDAPYLGLGVCFSPERVAKALIDLAEAGGSCAPETLPAFMLPVDASIAQALERLLAALADPLDAKLLAPLIVDELLYRLLRSDAAAAMRGGAGRPVDAKRILEVMQFIRAHHSHKLTVETLAKRVGMSPSHFAHRFTAVARTSPMRYLRQARLDRAHALLLESGARVSEVAIEVGFESPAHFTREYKRRFGMAPSKAFAAVGLR